ncbi:hypothetical protein V8C86DRAFT_3031356 [Haematococcus lacustris]
MAARVAACLAPWTRMAGFIANRPTSINLACVLKRALVPSALIARGTTWASSCTLHCPWATQPQPTPYLQPQPTPHLQPSTPARPARVVRRPSRFATDSSLLTPPPPSTPFLPSSLSQGSASASPSTPHAPAAAPPLLRHSQTSQGQHSNAALGSSTWRAMTLSISAQS